LIVKERYDIVVSYLEGPTTHIISGCLYEDTRTVTWVHVEMESMRQLAVGFRNGHEAIRAYNKFDRVVFVAESVKKRFEETAGSQFANTKVLYNTIKSDEIRKLAAEETPEVKFSDKEFNIISVGRLIPAKGYDRLVNVCQRLVRDGYKCHMYILGQGAEEKSLRDAVTAKNLAASFTFLGFKNNPYKYTKKANLYVCSSRREGFSTAVTEALIVGTPVITTNVSGMREMLGDNEYGVITDNDEEALYRGIKRLMDDPALLAHYRKKAAERGKAFSTEKTVKAVEEMLLEV
jgi:glycosyltransferase involved in cell wall biosynthesis